MIEAGIALAVAAIPEGLPAVATITLAVGMRLMARRNALVRKLPAVETLGSVTCVCTDKTGTLTRGEMTQRTLVLPDREIDIGGSGYAPQGEFTENDEQLDPLADPVLEAGLLVGVLCNNADLARGEDGAWRITGDPTEGALVVAAQKAGMDVADLRGRYPERHEFPFSSEKMNMATINAGLEGELPQVSGLVSCVKGAPDRVLADCTRVLSAGGVEEMSDDLRSRLAAENEALAEDGYRVLALAYRPVNSVPEERRTACENLIWIGLAGIMDPPRKEAGETVAVMTRAGVSTVMITGDQPLTARTIAAELGVAQPDGPVLSGADLDEMSDEELIESLEDTEVFARVSPEHKLRILNALQARGEVCSMLGDGVNDAAALKSADIGVAMGQRGTDVAKETSDMVLLDDRFSTIGAAIHRGRIIYDNIRKFITYLFSCNLSEIFTMLAGSLMGYPLILLPLQILWMNLITDVFPALALAAEPGEKDVMDRPPADPDEPLIVGHMIRTIGGYGLLLTLAAVGAFRYGLYAYDQDPSRAVTFSFLTIAFSQLFHVFNCRKHDRPMSLSDWLSNRWVIGGVVLSAVLMLAAVYVPLLQRILGTFGPAASDWLVILACAIAPLILGQAWRWVVELRK
jgi:Ca2+-transporting ATPase